MRLGIDFGTTHTVVATVDRGNYPIVSFEHADFVPSLAAAGEDGTLRFGAQAAAVAHDPAWTVLRSFKRLLNDAGPESEVAVGPRTMKVVDLLTGFLSHVRDELYLRSNAHPRAGEPLKAAVSVPANASSAQRILTVDAFRRAGFDVVALLNEPSAAGFEYAHRFRETVTSKREYVLVYDLGGGTFDASLIKMEGRANEVVTSSGVARLGGDDFDEAILRLVEAKLRSARAADAGGDGARDARPAARERRRRLERAGRHLRGGGRQRVPARVPPLARALRRAPRAPLAASFRFHGHRARHHARRARRVLAGGAAHAALRGVPRGERGRGGVLRRAPAQGHVPARSRRAAAERDPPLPRGAQPGALPVRRVRAHRAGPAGGQPGDVGRGAVPLRPAPARGARPGHGARAAARRRRAAGRGDGPLRRRRRAGGAAAGAG